MNQEIKKIMSIDAETDGLWGNLFSIAITIHKLEYRHYPSYRGGGMNHSNNWNLEETFLCRLDTEIQNEWVKENVIPQLQGVPVTHNSYELMIKDAANFYLENKAGATIICHMGYIVEAFLFREMRRLGFISDFEAPYPLIDISAMLLQKGYNPTSVDDYRKEAGKTWNIGEGMFGGSTHNPLYDCAVATDAFIHMLDN